MQLVQYSYRTRDMVPLFNVGLAYSMHVRVESSIVIPNNIFDNVNIYSSC